MADKPKILCVDDRAENLRIRVLLLEQFGCEVVAATDQKSALRAVAESHPDLAIIDYHLAGNENGEDLARDIRVMDSRIRLVMLTGDNKLPESAVQVVDAVLIKGASNPRSLFETIEKLLPGADLRPLRPMIIPDRKAS